MRRGPGGEQGGMQSTDPSARGAIEIPPSITVKELADLIGVNSADIIRELIKSGIFATINQPIDRDTAALVTTDLGYEVAEPDETTPTEAAVESVAESGVKEEIAEGDDPTHLVSRAPIVTVMGHVDHGKTSLLDAIRKTSVAAGEKGGITQAIGASEVEHNGRRLVFLDTPGHEAFTAMRARGARVTDIAVLVVAADDGVMPQTIEAIDHARAARVPIVVALNKIDKPDATPDRVKTELSEHNVIVEEYGGDTPIVPTSAKTGLGIDDLLETILITSDALVDPKADPRRTAVGTVVEAERDKGRGPIASILVQTGTLRVGDIVVVGETWGRVRALENSHGKRVPKAGPSSAVVVLGLSDVPAAGDILRVVGDEKTARTTVEQRREAQTARPEGTGRATLEDLYRQIQAGQTKELRIILKADVQGSLGAVTHALGQLQTDGVRINILHEGTGDITDNDVNLASASDAVVVGFNTKVVGTARRAAESEGVEIRLYDIIYKLTEEMDAALRGMLEPEEVIVTEGRAEVRQIFKVGKTTQIAGSYVTDGRIVRGGARVYRGGKLIATDRIDSLRRFRDDVREVATGYECGIGLSGFHDFSEGDIIECFTTQMVSRAARS
ncbi:MAG: translation initiation factor IF-2 [Chloroflexota bacterium]